jgi:hypothetical protein
LWAFAGVRRQLVQPVCRSIWPAQSACLVDESVTVNCLPFLLQQFRHDSHRRSCAWRDVAYYRESGWTQLTQVRYTTPQLERSCRNNSTNVAKTRDKRRTPPTRRVVQQSRVTQSQVGGDVAGCVAREAGASHRVNFMPRCNAGTGRNTIVLFLAWPSP